MPESQVIKDPYKDLEPMIVEIIVPMDIDKHILTATVKSQNPLDCLVLTAEIIDQIRIRMNVEPVVKIIQ